MATAWSTVENIDHAAAFRALGIKVMSDKGEHLTATTATRAPKWARWSVCQDGNLPGTTSPIGPLVRAVRHQELAEIDPAHPLLDFLAIMAIRHQLVDALHNGTAYRIDIEASVYGAVLIRAPEPALVRQPPHIQTGDLKLAACLIRLGLPLARIEGTRPDSKFILASPGYEFHGSAPADGFLLVPAFRALSRLTWAVPAPEVPAGIDPVLNRLRSLMHALWVRDRLHDYIGGRAQNLIVTSPFNHRQLLISENTDGAVLDRCRQFLHVP